jgi:hypothetical protein
MSPHTANPDPTQAKNPITRRWFAFVRVIDRSGTSTAITGVFSERGVSFGSLSTLDVHDGLGTMSVEFRASERLAHVLVRTVERLAVVKAVTLVHAEDPCVRALGVVATGGREALTAAQPHVTVWTEGSGTTLTTVLSGPLVEVERAVEALRDAGATSVAITVLPPR